MRFSVCLSAYNEAEVIEETVSRLLTLNQAAGPVDVWVYNDCSDDGTGDILDRMARLSSARLHVVHGKTRQGKAHGIQTVARASQADILIFTDATCLLAADVPQRLAERFRDPEVGVVCGALTYLNVEESATANVGANYWSLEERIKDLESRTGQVIGADGSLFAVRRHLYPELPHGIVDDFYVPMVVLCAGYKVVRAPDARVSEASVTETSEEFRRKTRISCGAFDVHRRIWPKLRRQGGGLIYRYLSHKFLRWFVGPNLVLAALFGIGGIAAGFGWIAAGVMLAGCLLTLAGLSLLKPGLVRSLFEVGSAFAATAVGVAQSLSGRSVAVWTPAASIRKRA